MNAIITVFTSDTSINPAETGWYYLKSRYYDPEVGRFINADEILNSSNLRGYNVYSYCLNDSINLEDPDGHWAKGGGMRSISWFKRSTGKRMQPAVKKPWSSGQRTKSASWHEKKNAVDLTEKLTAFMENNAQKFETYIDTYGRAKAMIYFYENVNNGGALDIKLQDEWKFEIGKTYYFNGKKLRYDDPGNINYGYVGAVLFPDVILCMAAGGNQVKNHGFKFGDISTWYDDPRDNEMIKYGYSLYIQGD